MLESVPLWDFLVAGAEHALASKEDQARLTNARMIDFGDVPSHVLIPDLVDRAFLQQTETGWEIEIQFNHTGRALGAPDAIGFSPTTGFRSEGDAIEAGVLVALAFVRNAQSLSPGRYQ